MQRMSTRHGNKAEILQLMKETFANRRKWIINDDRPSAEEVHTRYPCIKRYDVVSLNYIGKKSS